MFPTSCLLRKAPKLTIADFYIVLVADTSDLDNFSFESFRQLKSLCTTQLLSLIRILCTAGGFENSVD
jgi:hypothetical protein